MKRALALLAILGLSACAVGPNYRTPNLPPKGEGAFVSASPEVAAPQTARDDWWRLYNDPVLDTLIQRAFAANTDLRAAQANLGAARGVLDQARAGLFPSTTISGGAAYGRSANADSAASSASALHQAFPGANLTALGPTSAQTGWTYNPEFDVSYEVDLFGRVRRTIQAAKGDYQSTQAALDAVKITVAAETTRAYVEICALGEQLAVARHSLEVVSHEAEITRQRYDAGGGSEFDVVRTDEVVAETRSAIPPLEGQRRAAVFQLAAMLGRTPALAPREALACETPPRLVSLIPVGDGVGLLKRRPDVRLADRRLAAATARIGVATADLYPRISLAGFYGGAASDLSGLIAERGLVWGVGPSISWSFPNMAGPRARVHAAKAEAAGALAGFDSTVLQALKETEQALSTYGAELDHHQALIEAQTKAQRALEMAHGQYVAGAVSTLDLLTSEQVLVAADTAVAASDAALVQDQVAVFKALGGGWRSGAGAG